MKKPIVENEYVQSKKAALMMLLSLINEKSRERGKPVKISFDAFSRLMMNVGYGFSFYEFEAMAETDPELLNIVSDYNDEFMVVGDTGESPFDAEEREQEQEEEDEETVSQMAKSATDRRQ